MGNATKPPTSVPRKTLSRPAEGAVSKAIRETASDAVKDAVFEKRPYLKLAFKNPYNLSLFIGGLVASVLTLNPVPALLALGAESLWLLHAPDSKYLRRLL